MHEESTVYEVGVIGGGIVGLATAMAMVDLRRPIIVVEAESRLGVHQTGHNSGVIHSGLYYRPGSLKARLCVQGREALYDFCERRGVPYERCGKVVVATDGFERSVLSKLEQRGRENGLDGLRMLDPASLGEHEPHAAGVAALHVPETGIVDFGRVVEAMADAVREAGHRVVTDARVMRVRRESDGLVLETTRGAVRCRYLVNCAGLESDRVALMCGVDPRLWIVPFRGEYYELVPGRRHLARNLIYPTPDPELPFLGVHFTRMINGGVEAGPNAVLAFSRRGYSRLSFSPADMLGTALYPGFWRMSRRNWRMGIGEMRRSLSKGAFVKALQRLVPDVRRQDVRRCGAGLRAQAVEPDGRLVDDFRIRVADRMIHVLNAPSPAATASISIGRHIAEEAARQFDLQKTGEPLPPSAPGGAKRNPGP